MNHVPQSWLIKLHIIYILCSLSVIGLFIAFKFLPINPAIAAHWGFVPLVLYEAIIYVLYMAAVYPFTSRRFAWLSNQIGMVLFVLIIITLNENSGHTNLIYRIGYIIFIFSSSLNGIYAVTMAVILTLVVLVLSIAGASTPGRAPLFFNLFIDTLVVIAGFGGWRLFRRYYEKPANQDVDKLSNLLTQERIKSNFIIESISDGVVVTNNDGNIQLINKAAGQLVGWTGADAQGTDYLAVFKFKELKSEQTLTEGPVELVLKDGKPLQSRYILDKQGESLYADVTASPVHANQDASAPVVGVVLVVRDITAQIKQEQRLSDFISTASHEMRTPVAAIEGYLALALNDKVSTIDSKARDYLEKAHESTQHLGRLFQDLLTSTKAEDGRLGNHPSVVEMSGFLEKVVEDLRFSAEKKGLHMEYVMGTPDHSINATTGEGSAKMIKPLYYVQVDPERLREVITNLFDNAVKYTESGSVTVGLTGNVDVVQLSVRDTGPGIPPEDIPHLFQKFYRVDNTATRTIGGTGLGLFICQKIVELYNGRIWVESKLQEGSTFFINLPRLGDAKAKELQAAQTANTVVTPLSSPASS